MPVAFDCPCGTRWWSPPQIECPACGPTVTAVPDPIVWSVGTVPGTTISISAQLRDRDRFEELVAAGAETFVDVAGAAPYVWRPAPSEIEAAGVEYVRVDGVEDLNVDLPAFAFDAVHDVLAADRRTLVFCAAGLKRSPHLVYGVLRRRGLDPQGAWDAVAAARPFADRWQPYVDAAERWLAG